MSVATELNPNEFNSKRDLEDLLIEQLSPRTGGRALKKQQEEPANFGNEYWRKYRKPFWFRLVKILEERPKKIELPRYWAWRTLVAACDGNCRWFLDLADECWRLYWSKGGLRPLSTKEQGKALSRLAERVNRKCGSFGDKGDILRELVRRVAQRLHNHLYGSTYIHAERTNVGIIDASTKQRDAIALGIAYSFFVPRLTEETSYEEIYVYPTTDVEVRLGYPISVAHHLLMRSVSTLRIDDLRQAELPLWPS